MTESYINAGLRVVMVNRVPWRAAVVLGRLWPTQPLKGVILGRLLCPSFGCSPEQLFIHNPSLRVCQTQAQLVSCGGALSSALCNGKEHSLPAQMLQMSGTQHGNKMVFPNGNHPTDLICLHLNYCSYGKSYRAVCSYQMNYRFINNMRGCITFWIISSCAREGYTEIQSNFV